MRPGFQCLSMEVGVLRPMLEGLPWPGVYCDRIPLTCVFSSSCNSGQGRGISVHGDKEATRLDHLLVGHPCSRSSQTPRCLSVNGVFPLPSREGKHISWLMIIRSHLPCWWSQACSCLIQGRKEPIWAAFFLLVWGSGNARSGWLFC